MTARVVASLLALAATAGCAGIDVPRATPLDVERAAGTRPGTTLAELERGRSLYLAKCTNCHQPISPHAYTPAAWPAEIAEMAERSKATPAEVDMIALYLTTVSTKR